MSSSLRQWKRDAIRNKSKRRVARAKKDSRILFKEAWNEAVRAGDDNELRQLTAEHGRLLYMPDEDEGFDSPEELLREQEAEEEIWWEEEVDWS